MNQKKKKKLLTSYTLLS